MPIPVLTTGCHLGCNACIGTHRETEPEDVAVPVPTPLSIVMLPLNLSQLYHHPFNAIVFISLMLLLAGGDEPDN
jgi:hypothetical protein